MTDDTSHKPQANIADINRILGNRARYGIERQSRTDVIGVNPEKFTCTEFIIRGAMAMVDGGHMITRFVAANGSADNVGIGFANGSASSGIYSPAVDRISISIAGNDVCAFTPLGVGMTNVYSPTGTMDFGGATLTGIGGIAGNPNAYDLIGIPTTTIGATTATALDVPTLPTAGFSGNWELDIRIIYVLAGSGGTTNGVYTSRARAFVTVGSTNANVSAQYQTTINHDPLFVGTAVAVVAIAGANRVHIDVTGRAGQTIIWQAKCSVVRVES